MHVMYEFINFVKLNKLNKAGSENNWALLLKYLPIHIFWQLKSYLY